jgi:hypothetical protein
VLIKLFCDYANSLRLACFNKKNSTNKGVPPYFIKTSYISLNIKTLSFNILLNICLKDLPNNEFKTYFLSILKKYVFNSKIKDIFNLQDSNICFQFAPDSQKDTAI